MESDASLPSVKAMSAACTANNHRCLPVGGNCKQYLGEMADCYPVSHDVMSHVVFYIYRVQ